MKIQSWIPHRPSQPSQLVKLEIEPNFAQSSRTDITNIDRSKYVFPLNINLHSKGQIHIYIGIKLIFTDVCVS